MSEKTRELSVQTELERLWDIGVRDSEHQLDHVRLDRYAYHLLMREARWHADFTSSQYPHEQWGRWRNLPIVLTAPKMPSRIPNDIAESETPHAPSEICVVLKQSVQNGRFKYLDSTPSARKPHATPSPDEDIVTDDLIQRVLDLSNPPRDDFDVAVHALIGDHAALRERVAELEGRIQRAQSVDALGLAPTTPYQEGLVDGANRVVRALLSRPEEETG